MKRHDLQIPRLVVGPQGILKLVLNIEQPDPGRGRQQHDWQMHKQERTDADEPYHRGDKSRDGDVCRAGAEPGLPTTTHHADWQPVLYDEQIGRGQAEHDDRVPVDPVTQPTPSAPREVLVHSQGVDVTDSAVLEIA